MSLLIDARSWIAGMRQSIASLCLILLAGLATPVWAQTTTGFQYFYDDLGQLTKVVDSTGNVVEYVYDPVGNILQIKRTSIAPGTLAIFDFTPQQGSIGQSVTIQGQGFSSNPASNLVRFNGTAATVVSALSNSLVALVPQGASSGLISVTVGNQTATSSTNFTVIPAPVIASMSRKSALFNTTVPNLGVIGFNLAGATFVFQPTFSMPAITVTSGLTDPSGLSATLGIQTGTEAGTFALTGTNSFGSSNSLVTKSNRFTVVDPRSNADSTGTGIPDAIKALFGADPLDPNSVPTILPTPEVESLTVSVLNGTAPPHISPVAMEADSLTVSLLNGTLQASSVANEADSLTVSLVNGVAPSASSPILHEADSLTTSLLNGIAPPVQPTVFEADSLTISLSNSAPKTTNRTSGTNPAYASLNRHPQPLLNGTNSRRRSSAKPKTRKRTQPNEGD